MEVSEIIVKPLVTEKSTKLTKKQHTVCFAVAKKANKHQIKRAIEAFYEVKIDDIRTLIMAGKPKRRAGKMYKQANFKKAWVTLAEGYTLDFLAAE